MHSYAVPPSSPQCSFWTPLSGGSKKPSDEAIPYAKPAVHPHIPSLLCATLLHDLIHYLGEDGLQIELPEGLNERPVEEVRTLGRVFRSIERTQSLFLC